MMMRHKQQLFVNGTLLTKETKLSFMAQVSVILKRISKICMMPKAIKSTALQIQWNSLTIKVPQPVQAGDMVRALKKVHQSL